VYKRQDEERTRLEKDLVETEGQINRLQKLLASPFAEKAPHQVVQSERDKLVAFQKTAENLKGQLVALNKQSSPRIDDRDPKGA